MSLRLYEIPLEADQIEQELHENLGELTPELQARIEDFLAQGKSKIEAAAIVVKSMEADAEVCKAEGKRLLERSARLTDGADHLTNLMLFAVDHGFAGKVKTAKFTIWGQNAAAVTSFDVRPGTDMNALMAKNPEFIRLAEPALDKIALKEADKAGAFIPEEITVDRRDGTRFLRIK